MSRATRGSKKEKKGEQEGSMPPADVDMEDVQEPAAMGERSGGAVCLTRGRERSARALSAVLFAKHDHDRVCSLPPLPLSPLVRSRVDCRGRRRCRAQGADGRGDERQLHGEEKEEGTPSGLGAVSSDLSRGFL